MEENSKLFGLIGYPLGHSYSCGHFARKFSDEGLANHRYVNFEIPSVHEIRGIIDAHPNLVGLNVTIPYKKEIIPYLDELDPIAEKIGAVNTIKICRSGYQRKLIGYNTDVIGFRNSISHWPINHHLRALVMGTGGSSLAIKFALEQLGIEYLSVSRNNGPGLISYASLTESLAYNHKLWINCTPVGMYPKIEELLPLPYKYLSDNHFLFDLVYNPEITRFLRKGIDAGARVMNGSAMLYGQAEASWEIWNC